MFFKFILSHYRWVLFAWILMIGVFSAAVVERLLSGDSIADNSVGTWFMHDDPALVQFRDYLQDFGSNEWSMILVKTDSIFDKDFLEDLADATQRLEQVTDVVKATSIATFQDNKIVEEDALWYTSIYTPDGQREWSSAAERTQFKQLMLNNENLLGTYLHKGDEQTTILLIQSDNRLKDPKPYRSLIQHEIDTIFSSYDTIESYHLVGTMPTIVEMNKLSVLNVYIFYTSTVVLITLFGLIVFRNLRDLFTIYVATLGTLIPSMGVLCLLDRTYNMATQIMPVLFAAIATANVVHLIKEFHQLRSQMADKEALYEAMTRLWKPGLWATTTTTIGFCSFMFSSVPPFQELGGIGAMGVILGWLMGITACPAALVLFYQGVPQRGVRGDTLGDGHWHHLPNWIHNNRHMILGIFALFALSFVGLKDLRVDTNFVGWFNDKAKTTLNYNALDDAKYPTSYVSATLTFPNDLRLESEEIFQQLMAFENALKNMPGVITTYGIGEMLWQIEKVLSDGRTSYQEFLQYNEGELSDIMFSGVLSGNRDLDDVRTPDHDRVQILVMTEYMSSVELHAFKRKIESLFEQTGPSAADLLITGNAVMLANMDREVYETQLITLGVVSIFLLITLPIIFRSWVMGFAGLLLNLFPLAFTYSLMAWSGITVNLATVIVGGISLSIVVDDTIHFLFRFKYFQAQGMAWHEAIEETISTIGHSITLTSVILIGAFSVLTLSTFMPIFAMGVFFSIAIVMAWAMDLLLVPVLLRYWGQWADPELAAQRRASLPET